MGLADRLSSGGMFSADDSQRVSDMKNHPEYEPGFDGGGSNMFDDSDFGGGGGFDDLFGDGGDSGGSSGSGGFDDLFGSSSSGGSDPFGSSSSGSSDPFGSGSSGSSDPFGSNSFGNNSFGNSSFGPTSPFQQGNAQQSQGSEALDKLVDAGADAAKNVGAILMELVKSIKLRNADDIGYYSRNLIICGIVFIPLGIILGLVGMVFGSASLGFSGLGTEVILSGALLLGSGTTGMGSAAFVLSKTGVREEGGIENLPDINESNNFTDDYEDSLGDELDDLFDDEEDDLDSLFDDEDTGDDLLSSSSAMDLDTSYIPEDEEEEPMDFESALEGIRDNSVLNRQTLFNTFKPLLPTETPDFAKFSDLEPDSPVFENLEMSCIKSLANLANMTLEEVTAQTSLESARESLMIYELKLKRINKVKKVDELATEIERYVKEDSSDDSVTVTVKIEGDFYKIIITKGASAIITFGDIFKDNKICDFYLNDKNKLPIITGIDELGNVILEDAKVLDTMLIAGKPRSGKSWYVLGILMSMIMFNTPEDVQFCIIDPKESNLFKTMALLPHVCGLHTDEHILDILNDIIDIEAPRRKKLLADNRCDDVWAIRKKGINLPILYVVIDEYMTVVGNLDSDGKKELDGKLKVLISQLPSLGIRLLFVPHRATGVVDKTNRTMLQFTAAVRANNDDVEDTLGIKKWSRALTSPGDVAIKSSNMKDAKYVKGVALTTDDGDNTIFIETVAKAFYKMGVEIPDMSNMRIAVNRDEDYIKHELHGSGGNRVQYSSADLDNVDDLDIDEFIN